MSLTADQEKVRRKLIERAREEKTVTYGEVASWVGISSRAVGLGILDPINEMEIREKKPMLSALVVYRDSGRPGSGFFGLAKQLGVQAHDLSDELFWHREIAQVFVAHKKGPTFWTYTVSFIRCVTGAGKRLPAGSTNARLRSCRRSRHA